MGTNRRLKPSAKAFGLNKLVSVGPKFGGEITLYASLKDVGRSSMRVHVDVWARGRFGTEAQKVTDADFVFVAPDEDGKPRPIRER